MTKKKISIGSKIKHLKRQTRKEKKTKKNNKNEKTKKSEQQKELLNKTKQKNSLNQATEIGCEIKEKGKSPSIHESYSDTESISKETDSLKSIHESFFQNWINTLSSMAQSSFKSLLEQEEQEENEKNQEETKKTANYCSEDRFKALIEIKRTLFYFTNYSNIHIPKSYLFSVIALVDCFLANTEKKVNNLSEMRLIFFCAMKIIAKDLHIDYFLSNDFFKNMADKDTLNKLEIDLIYTVDAVIYPMKAYDYFQRIFAFSYQNLTSEKSGDEYNYLKNILLQFYKVFHQNYFVFTLTKSFEEDQIKPSVGFFTIFKLVIEKLKDHLGDENSIYVFFEKNLSIIEQIINCPKDNYEKYKKEIDEGWEKLNNLYNN